MNAENGRMFRSALSGYNKDDVNRYILETDRRYKEEKDKLAKDIEDMGRFNVELASKNEALTEQTAAGTARIAELEAEVARLTEEAKATEETLRDITKRHDFYKAQTDAQNDALAKAKDEKTSLNDKIAALTEEGRKKDEQLKANAEKYAADLATLRQAYEDEIKTAKDSAKVGDDVSYKLDMYDKISSQIGDILINANRNADEILTTAKREAEKLLRDANTEATENATRMKTDISASADRTMREIREEFAGSMAGCASEIQTCITELQYEANALLALLQKKQAEVGERLEFYNTGVAEMIKERLGELDSDCDHIIRNDK